MSCATPQPEPTDDAEAPDPSVGRALRRLRVLEELAEIGMGLARALRDHAVNQAVAEGAARGDLSARAGPRDPADAFARLSRAIRLTLALEAKTDKALRALQAGVEGARERERLAAGEHARLAGAETLRDREARIRDLIMDAAQADLREDGDWERLDAELDERLMIDDRFWSDPGRPMREVVERYCAYFSLNPDWSRWVGEDWVPQGPPGPPDWPWAPRPRAADGRPGTAAGVLELVHDLE